MQRIPICADTQIQQRTSLCPDTHIQQILIFNICFITLFFSILLHMIITLSELVEIKV